MTKVWVSGLNIASKFPSIKGNVKGFSLITVEGCLGQMSGSNKNLVYSTQNDNVFHAFGKFKYEGCLYETKNPNEDPIIKIASGFYHNIILTQSGRLFGFADSGFYQATKQGVFSKPFEIDFFKEKPSQVIDISCSEMQSLFLCENGDLYGVGKNTYLQLDVNKYTTKDNKSKPHVTCYESPVLMSKNVKMMQMGYVSRHTIYQTTDNELWCCGSNTVGQLGLNSKSADKHTTKITLLTDKEKEKIRKIIVGFQMSLLLIGECGLYTCGDAIGNGLDTETLKFVPIPFFQDIPIQDVLCGSYNTLVLSTQNELYGFGHHEFGMELPRKPAKIELPDYDNEILALSMGVDNLLIFAMSNSSLINDFLNFYEAHEFTDYKIKNFKVHKSFLEFRLNSPIGKIDEILKEYTKEELDLFLKWVYSGKITAQGKLISQIYQKFEIDIPMREKSLQNDLLKLYKDDNSKDFTLLVKEEEEEESFDEIPIHKFVFLARSGLFREMFKNINQNEIDQIKDYSGKSIESLEILIRFFYADTFELTADDDPELIVEELDDAVEYYQLNEISTFKKVLNSIKTEK
ncbi:regulator of chromosome condensation [Anaeramoeba flamelloides]|uniref:Regulator of chromosome condensation n=1 Tax=Anaeramoeba flamelloides TaxID=1746091 RepID=A0ABQ8ZBS2_9EUKA|nr:regulator of chromosome condensation [Anaeramoeba flamelloides]